MSLVWDTNIYVDFAAGVSGVVDLIVARAEPSFFPTIVLGELEYGFMMGSRQRFNQEKLRRIIQDLRMEIIPVDGETARSWAVIYAALSRKGQRIPINDVWIAASCMRVGGTLLTRGRHFEQVDQISKIII